MNEQAEPLLPHILVVDDDDRLRDLLRRYLSENGFIVNSATDATDAEEKLASLAFDLVVLDIMMPGISGLEFAAKLREKGSRTPILLLTAMSESEDRINGLEVGADDYLTKPFEPRELLLRIRSILRRVPQESLPETEEVAFGEYVFDLKKGRLTRSGEPIHLTTQEHDILRLLAQQAGQPVSREQLAQAGGFTTGNERSVDVQINRLRKKLESATGRPQHITTARGSGYLLQVD